MSANKNNQSLARFASGLNLPESPIGDLSLPETFGNGFAVGELGDFDDMDEDDEDGDYADDEDDDDDDESGGPKVKRTVARGSGKRGPAKAAARIVRAKRVTAKDLAALNRRAPNAASRIIGAASARAASRTDWLKYEHAKGMRIMNSTINPSSTLEPYEVTAIKSHVTEVQLLQPQIINITLTSGAGTVDVDAILNSVYSLAPTTLFTYIGAQLYLSASKLNLAPGANVTLTRKLGSTANTLTTTLRLTKAGRARFTWINGNLIAGNARYYKAVVPSIVAASNNWTISLSGVPTGYTAQLRLFIPGDAEVEKLLALL